MLRNIFFILPIICSSIPSVGIAASNDVARNQLKVFDIKHPRCESQTLVETAKETFTTIANDLPGRTEYNELVKTFHRGQWEKLDQGFDEFSSMFEDSPLREAVAFLRVESLFDRIDEKDSPILPEAEKALRETLLLYPRSKLIPNIQATVGAFWLSNGMYTKSLALFMKAKDENPFHPLSCFFQFGIGENNFLLHEKEAAKKSFSALLQKCNSPRLTTGASLRLIEIESDKKSNDSTKKLELLYEKESNIMRRFYPEALYNLGEGKYQKGDYRSARFFFSEYLNHKHTDSDCVPYASKRIADISARLKAPIEETIGLYLQAFDRNPKSDIAKYAYIEGMLLDYPQKNRSEQERRTTVIDEKIAALNDPKLRYLASLNKGFSLLEAGQLGALEHLSKTARANPEELKNLQISEFVSSKLTKILRQRVNESFGEENQKESARNDDLFNPFEDVFSVWIKGSTYEKEAKDLYLEMVSRRFKELIGKEKWDYAFEILERWKKSPLWSKNDPPAVLKMEVGNLLSAVMMRSEADKQQAFFNSLEQNESTLADFVTDEFSPLFVACYLNKKDFEGVSQWLKKGSSQRKMASINLRVAPEVRDFLNLKKSEGYFAVKKFALADETAKSVRSSKFLESATAIRVQSLQAIKQFSNAYKVGMSQIQKFSARDSKVRGLESLLSVVSEGKLWDKVEPLLVQVRKEKPEPKKLAPFLYLNGKVQSERKNTKKCISLLTEALKLDPEFSGAIEGKFRVARCLAVDKKKDLAKKQWQEVIDSKDSFWAPLAKSELNLMEAP